MESTSYCYHILIKCDFFLAVSWEKTPVSNFVKVRLVGTELFHADGRTNVQNYRHGEANSCSSYMVLRRKFGRRRDEVTGEWRRLHNEELNDLYSSLNIVRVIK